MLTTSHLHDGCVRLSLSDMMVSVRQYALNQKDYITSGFTYEGPATIESYTVHYGRDGSPKSGVIVALTPSGSRTLAGVAGEDAAMIAFLTDGMHEPVGSAGNVTRGDGDLSMWVRG